MNGQNGHRLFYFALFPAIQSEICNFAPNDKQPMNKQDWTYKKLGEVATFINGYPFKPTDWENSGRKIIRIQNLNNPNAVYNFYDGSIDTKYLVSNGDVLISWSGSLGVFEWSEDEAILNQHIFKVVFNKEKINKRYFEYVVASRINEMKTKVQSGLLRNLTCFRASSRRRKNNSKPTTNSHSPSSTPCLAIF